MFTKPQLGKDRQATIYIIRQVEHLITMSYIMRLRVCKELF